VTTRAENIGVIQNLINEIDLGPAQVLILAQILETTTDKISDIGIDWTVEGQYNGPTQLMQVYPRFVSGPGFGTLDFSKLAATLKLLRNDSDTKLISSPQIATLSNQEAVFLARTVQEYIKKVEVTVSQGGTTSSFEVGEAEAKIQLKVTPQVTPDGNIIMTLQQEVSSVDKDFMEFSVPPGTTVKLPKYTVRSTQTRVMVRNGRTLVMSGLFENGRTFGVTGVPGLSEIPLVGHAFKKEKREKTGRDLVFFITPIVMEDNNEYLKDLSRSRIKFLSENQDPWSALQNIVPKPEK
jgi:type II secretory pathway component GspD/PulD (secretin)